MARKKKPEEHENHERWLISYADFITLLFAFFVVMYSVSSVNEGKFRVLSASLDAAFRSSKRSMQPIQIGQIMKSPGQSSSALTQRLIQLGLSNLPPPRFNGIGPGVKKTQSQVQMGSENKGSSGRENSIRNATEKIQSAINPLIKRGLVGITQSGEWIEVEINSSILFASGSAKLSRQAIPILEKIARILSKTKPSIHVEGFTDNIPIRSLLYPSNWELSAARASSVVHLFARSGLKPNRMAAVGYGKYHPIASNKTARGRMKNRRVVLVINPSPNPRFSKKNLGEYRKPSSIKGTSKSFLKNLDRGLEKQIITRLKTRSRSKNSQKPGGQNKERYNKQGVFPIIQSPIELPSIPPIF